MLLIHLKLRRCASIRSNHGSSYLFIYLLFNVGYLRLIVSKFSLHINVKAYGGGGSPSSSSFIIRMDEYNQWLSMNSS